MITAFYCLMLKNFRFLPFCSLMLFCGIHYTSFLQHSRLQTLVWEVFVLTKCRAGEAQNLMSDPQHESTNFSVLLVCGIFSWIDTGSLWFITKVATKIQLTTHTLNFSQDVTRLLLQQLLSYQIKVTLWRHRFNKWSFLGGLSFMSAWNHSS